MNSNSGIELCNIVIPIVKKHIRCPVPLRKLIFQLNHRGFYTSDITWGEPIEIKMESFDWFMKNIKLWRMSNNRNIRELYMFMVNEIDLKTKITDPRISGNRSDKDLLTISILLPQSKIKKLSDLFYKAHIKNK